MEDLPSLTPSLFTVVFRRVTIFLTLTTVAFGVFRSKGSWETYQKLAKSRDILEHHVHSLEQETLQLQHEIQKLESSPIYAKRTLKDKYHQTEEKEEMILMQDPSTDSSDSISF